ncbi:YqgE/AlgH family protein [Haloferula sp.]|uniref:YqgE/AlgH family protein n=1 Tax=Haloferula sp. TaxID=2497595 RepID=UPI003C736852
MADSQIQLEGTLILADPSLRDGFFNRSVILLASHSADEGAHGLILNQPTGHDVGDFLKDEAFSHLARIPVYVGGPVSREQLTFSAFWWNPHDGLHWQLRLPAHEAIERSKQPGIIVRAFVGYSGWTAGQLESELRRESWIPAKPHPTLFGKEHNDRLWTEILGDLSPYHRILAEAPENPGKN